MERGGCDIKAFQMELSHQVPMASLSAGTRHRFDHRRGRGMGSSGGNGNNSRFAKRPWGVFWKILGEPDYDGPGNLGLAHHNLLSRQAHLDAAFGKDS